MPVAKLSICRVSADALTYIQVKPASMIWPYNLVLTTFLNTFHAEEDAASGKITRFKFFMIAFSGAFAWYFMPGTCPLEKVG